MCLYVNKEKTKNKPTKAEIYYKSVRFNEYDKTINSQYQGNEIKSGWYRGTTKDYPNGLGYSPDRSKINGGAIHVYTTLSNARKKINKSDDLIIIPVKCYPEDFVAYGSSSDYKSLAEKNPQACYNKVFIQEDDIRGLNAKFRRRKRDRERKELVNQKKKS